MLKAAPVGSINMVETQTYTFMRMCSEGRVSS